MPNPYDKVLAQLTAGYDVGYDVGDDDVGDDDVGDDDVGDDDVGATRPRRKGRRVLRAQRRVTMAHPRDKFDRVYAGALTELGSNGIPGFAIFHLEGAFADAAAVSISGSAPQAFVLTSLLIQVATVGALRNCTLTVGGNPVAGLTQFAAGRFSPDSTDRRLPPVEVPAGTPVVFTGTAASAAGTQYIAVDILGIPLNAGLSFATR